MGLSPCQLHEVTFNLRFQQRSGGINRPVSTCRRGRSFPIALCAMNKGKKCKQAFFPCVKCPTSSSGCKKQRSICASGDVLEASIDPFPLAEEGDVVLSPCVRLLGFPGGQKLVAVFSNLDAAINNFRFQKHLYCNLSFIVREVCLGYIQGFEKLSTR